MEKSQMTKNDSVHNLIRILWSPKEGDKVLLPLKNERPLKTLVTRVKENECSLKDSKDSFISSKLCYRPKPLDYEEALSGLSKIFIYRQEVSKSHHLICVKVNHGRVFLRGRARKILKSLLDLRLVDSEINNAVNQLVESRIGTKGMDNGEIRVHYGKIPNSGG